MDSTLEEMIDGMVSEQLEKYLGEDGQLREMVKEKCRQKVRREVQSTVQDLIREEISFVLQNEVGVSPTEGGGDEESAEPSSEPPGEEKDETSKRSDKCDEAALPGRYLYCVAENGTDLQWEETGVDDRPVYTVTHKDLSAVVHDTTTDPYDSEDEDQLKVWVEQHQSVVDAALRKCGAVLPVGFDTIFKPGEGKTPDQVLRDWLREKYPALQEQIDRLRGKREYGVQIIYDREKMQEGVAADDEEIAQLKSELESKPEGEAYLYREKLNKRTSEALSKAVDKDKESFLSLMRANVDELVVEDDVPVPDEEEMLLNLSCLLPEEEEQNLGAELEKIDEKEEYRVRFTGPWAPYSFVDFPAADERKGSS